MANQNQRLALIIGADGGIGAEIAKSLNAHGWSVRALTRRKLAAASSTPHPVPLPNGDGTIEPQGLRTWSPLASGEGQGEGGIGNVTNDWRGPVEWIKGDAMLAADVIAAASGAAVIVHAANPPGYQNWRGLAIPMLASSIAAAKVSGARLMLPGNVYNYGPDAFPLLTETSPRHPVTRKGKIRVEMEEMLRAAASQGTRSVVIRAGDFFGPFQPASWFKSLMITPGKPVTSVIYPGEFAVGHAWAYLPDLAETFAQVADRERSLPDFDTFHFGGHWIARGVDFAEAARRAGGHPNAPIRHLPLWFHLVTPFMAFLREAKEMQYLWRVPVQLDNTKLLRLLGSEPHTPLDQALSVTLRELGCLAPAALAA